MKKILLFLTLSAIIYTANCQRVSRSRSSVSTNPTSHFGVGVEGLLPLGENGKPYSFIPGFNVQYEVLPSPDLGLTASVGYLHYAIKSSLGGGSVGFVPLLAGIKYYFVPNIFFRAQLGAAVGTTKAQGTSFAYSPALGVKLTPNIDAELKYLGISNKGGTIENVGLRIGYNF